MIQRVAVFVAFFFVLEIYPVRAQILLQFPIEPPARVVQEALAHPYGQIIIEEFVKAFMLSAEGACLQSKGLDATKIGERGRELFQRYGTQSMEILIKNVDVGRYESKIAERAGRNAVSELMRLRDDPEVKQYLSFERPARLANILNFVVDNFERYVLLNRLRMRSFSGASTGNDGLLRADPTERSEDAVERFVAASTSAELKRFLEISQISAAALNDAFNREIALTWGPGTFYRGIENELTDLCITKR